ncbi:GNAT family N-acetyltransferase [Anaerocolumna chitinilytica]|uniref:N-acetyltransferase domain-containing protein n=1 Tax=Anaerocolumna chitinilytica TaxID=1727145 RepID=A0A7I8DGI3_9FIRM|nr:GNAT family N-acetyltransferase [Anaerocolumna chitinilytica]BCJ97472.1 hypothetical protein bsdcttw_05130 [Anaerocolumna chitinilytica]
MVCCRQARREEYEEIIDFINYVFSQNEAPHDFKKLLPKLYRDGNNYAEYHYLITEEEKIKALVCAMPISYRIGERELKACCIGMVSVHPYARSKGYMKQLLSFVTEELKTQGYQYIFLGGQRQRYEYFGFEPSGVQVRFTVTETNVRHCLKEVDASTVELVPLKEKELISQAYALYNKQPVKAIRKEDEFFDILCSWQCKPYGIQINSEFAGYLCLSQDGGVNEIVLKNTEDYPYALKALAGFKGNERNTFVASPLEADKINFLMKLAESYEIGTCENYLILDWKEVIETLLAAKAGVEFLEEGSLIIKIGKNNFEIKLKDNVPSVGKVELAADITLSELEAAALLFSYAGDFKLPLYGKNLDVSKGNCIKSWFPLPLNVQPIDCC